MNEVIKLIKVVNEQDSNGYIRNVDERITEVFAEKKSVTRLEFYSALEVGIAASATFLINIFDYDGETLVEHNQKRYKIERTFQKAESDYIELTCSDMKERGKDGTVRN